MNHILTGKMYDLRNTIPDQVGDYL